MISHDFLNLFNKLRKSNKTVGGGDEGLSLFCNKFNTLERPQLTQHLLCVLTDCIQIWHRNSSTHDTYLAEISFHPSE